MAGALSGVRILEIASLTPGPFACMMLSDLGAEVLRVDRLSRDLPTEQAIRPLSRGRRSVAIDLKSEAGAATVLRLVERADVLVEGFRPGVMERLGLGPADCLAVNPGLVYGRMTGWGQEGPLAQEAGHDINYLAISGALDPIGMARQRPVPPANMVGDLGGGGLVLALGILAALYERSSSGQGQVVDAAIVDGAALLTTGIVGLRAAGRWGGERGTNLADGGAPFYRTYECSDGRYIAVGAVEPQFYAALLAGLGIPADSMPPQLDELHWPETQLQFEKAFSTRTQQQWIDLFAGKDACVSPVLSVSEAPAHPHLRQRRSFVDIDGIVQPAPAPRLSRTPSAVQGGAPYGGEHTEAALADWGIEAAELEQLLASGTVR